MTKIYLIASGKGGTGKTTTAVNLGSALNKLNEDVVVVDTNITTPNLGLYFGAPVVPVSLNHVLQGKANIDEAIYEHESGIKIVPSSLSLKDMEKLDYDKFEGISNKLRKLFSHVIYDSAAGLGEESRKAMESCDEVVLVANPNILSVTDALKTIKFAEEMNKPVRGVIVTRVKGTKNDMTLKSIHEMLEVPLLGVVPEDLAVEASLNRKNSVVHTHPRSKAARAYQDIAAKLIGRKKKPEGFGKRFWKAMFG